jgi:hypothetical protein
MRVLTILLVFAAVAVGAVGCGGGSNSAATTEATSTETTTEESTTEATDTESETEATDTDTETSSESTSTEAAGSFNFGSGDCRKLAEAGKDLAAAMSSATSDKQKLEQAKQLYQSFVDKAPSDIKPDLQVLADAYSKIVDAVGDLNLKPGETPDAATIQKFQTALASIDNAKVQTASQHLTTWVTSNCGSGG